jgi:hypothetical protein
MLVSVAADAGPSAAAAKEVTATPTIVSTGIDDPSPVWGCHQSPDRETVGITMPPILKIAAGEVIEQNRSGLPRGSATRLQTPVVRHVMRAR